MFFFFFNLYIFTVCDLLNSGTTRKLLKYLIQTLIALLLKPTWDPISWIFILGFFFAINTAYFYSSLHFLSKWLIQSPLTLYYPQLLLLWLDYWSLETVVVIGFLLAITPWYWLLPFPNIQCDVLLIQSIAVWSLARYLQQHVSPTNRVMRNCHFFNTYFYNKLKEVLSNKVVIFFPSFFSQESRSLFHGNFVTICYCNSITIACNM